MACYQVVRMTRCEKTSGHPQLLRDMAAYVGFWWHPEYQVYEVPRDFGQTFYRATVYIKEDNGPGIVHKYEATASSVEMAVHLAAYYCVTVLRREYYCFNDSPFRHVPSGAFPTGRPHITVYTDAQYEEDRLWRTAQFAHHQDAVSRALSLELASVREQLHRALSHLSVHSREFVSDELYPRFELPRGHRLPDVGGYTPQRGPLLSVDPHHVGPLLYGRQGAEAYYFDTDRVPLPIDYVYRDRRSTHFSLDTW